MGPYLSFPILALAAILQSSIFPQFRILNGQPDLVLLLVVAWAIRAPLEEAVVWAFVGGLLQDLLSLTPLGTSSAGLVLLVFGINMLTRQVYNVNIAMIVGFVFAGTVLQHVLFVLVMAYVGQQYELGAFIRTVLLPTLFYNLLLILPIYALTGPLQKRTTGQRAT